ncbi:DUF4333 domain-containing protein [Amycolatopsis panacis]|uniref:DUF4333 domain-containing protein n=2 Tax=Amycolatopsis panacis TaxID=2340917 RepID=A0A419HLS9_9PSEU|nr:DUF4333 domain-containing protein [Amycolatopsis panacis]
MPKPEAGLTQPCAWTCGRTPQPSNVDNATPGGGFGAFAGDTLAQNPLQDGVSRVLEESCGDPGVQNVECPAGEAAENGTTVQIGGQPKKVTAGVLNDKPEYASARHAENPCAATKGLRTKTAGPHPEVRGPPWFRRNPDQNRFCTFRSVAW